MKSLRRILVGLTILSTLLAGLFYFGRNILLNKLLIEKIGQIERSKSIHISYADASFNGLASVSLQHLCVVPKPGDTLAYLGNLDVEVKLSSLIFGRINLRSLKLDNLHLRPKDIFGSRNFDFLISTDTLQSGNKPADSKGYASISDKLLTTLFDLLPASYTIHNLRISGIKNLLCTQIIVNKVESKNGEYNFWAGVYESGNKSYWHFIGKNDKSKRQVSGSLIRADKKGNFPVLFPLLGLKLSADTLDFAFEDKGINEGELQLKASLHCSNWNMEHWRIAPQPVFIPGCGGELNVKIGKDYLSVDSSTVIYLGKCQAQTYVHIKKSEEKWVDLKLNMAETASQDFFNSLPSGLFSAIEGIQTEGKLSFYLKFSIYPDQPEKVAFDAGLKRNGFRLKQQGVENLSKMNVPFLHTVYENGNPFKSFIVGPENPDFVPLEKISPYLQQSILSSEDGSFFGHTGFNMDAFKSSITANIKEKRFVRGASTISMQLVKNVFLTRNKTMARKLEEILIVWLIENLRITSKERMFEVYLNIIEWGPGIYGIGEASEFYFKKKPDELTLNESIFLASIIPGPKWFKYRFDEHGLLRKDMIDFYRIVANHLFKRGVISEEVKNDLLPGVVLTGKAKEFLNKTDSLLPDSNQIFLPVLPVDPLP